MSEQERRGAPAARQGDWRALLPRLPDAPEAFGRAILGSRARIRAVERARRRRRQRLAAAAAAVVMLGMSAAGLWRLRAPVQDRAAPSVPAAPRVEVRSPALQEAAQSAPPEEPQAEPARVFAHPEDECYHLTRDCPRCPVGAVALPPETAREFGKTPCPGCAGG